MSSEHGEGRSGLLKSRAENFAHHLQTRLRTLNGTEDTNWSSEINSSSDSEVYYDINSSLDSPEEELGEPLFIATQNRDNLPLERSDSSGSQFFDSVENIEDLSPVSHVSSLKKIPILHLKTDRSAAITNGHSNLLDADSGCSRVREMPYLELESEIRERVGEDGCDSSFCEENNNTGTGDESDKDLEEDLNIENSCDVETVEVDTRQSDGELPVEEAEEVTEATSDSFCMFCDIEQIKSSLSNKSTDNNVTHEEVIRNGHCKSSELESTPEKPHSNLDEEANNNSPGTPETTASISLSDLLQVLKKEISSESDLKSEEPNPAHAESDNSICPNIEIRESSPLAAETPIKHDEDEDFDIEIRRKQFRRCSSLKSGKTPPGTPGHKKIVRFADVLGLDLADVKTFLDEVPTVPKSAFEDLHGIEMSSSPAVDAPITTMTLVRSQPDKILIALFQQPSSQPNFLDRVRESNVCLENAFVSDMSLFAISGMVRVKNIDFHKSVYVRYSIDQWKSFSDLQAQYVPSSCDGFSDKFKFLLYAHTLILGQRLEFAIRFHTAGAQFWDSNGGVNYVFECTTRAPTRTYVDPRVPPSPIETWASFY